jgi:hypothetical protein
MTRQFPPSGQQPTTKFYSSPPSLARNFQLINPPISTPTLLFIAPIFFPTPALEHLHILPHSADLAARISPFCFLPTPTLGPVATLLYHYVLVPLLKLSPTCCT